MRKSYLLSLVAIMLFATSCDKNDVADEVALKSFNAEISSEEKFSECTTIQSGELLYAVDHYLEGEALSFGYDIFGYNYGAHMFKGSYANVYLGGFGFPPYEGDDVSYLIENPNVSEEWYWEYRNYEIEMKWNDAWLSNKDCDGDEKLDRHYGFDSYIGSGAYEMYSEKMGGDSDYTYKSKIIAVPANAYKQDGIWYAENGTEIGPNIWGQFAIIQEVQGGKSEDHGLLYKGMDHTGLGNW